MSAASSIISAIESAKDPFNRMRKNRNVQMANTNAFAAATRTLKILCVLIA